MQSTALPEISTASVASAVGATSYARGAQYARARAVGKLWWDESVSALRGYVRGSDTQPYATTVYLTSYSDGPYVYETGECSCPVGIDCKHAAALILTAAAALRTAPAPAEVRPERPAGWEQSLSSLLKSGSLGPAQAQATTALAIELSITQAAPGPHAYRSAPAEPAEPRLTLSARLVQQGKNGWIAGNLSWSRLETLSYYGNSYPPEHLKLLGEIFAVYNWGAGRAGYYSGYQGARSIDLGGFESSRLWALLDEASSIGLPLIYPHKQGPVHKYSDGELCLDITRGSGSDGNPDDSVVITPRLRIESDSPQASIVGFIGTSGHGLVYVEAAETQRSVAYHNWRFRLARLARPVPRELQQLTLACQQLSSLAPAVRSADVSPQTALRIPAAEQVRFRDGYYLRLRQLATVISSDDSFAPPQVSGPTLVLKADYGAEHVLEASWEWAYQVGDDRLAVRPGAPGDASVYRDLAAEQAILAGLDTSLDRFGLLPGGLAALVPGAPRAVLTGMDTMRFSTELLPLLASQPEVTVEVTGDPADYREVGDSLLIGISVDETADGQDWFDLGISISVEGREIPFVDVFTALSRGASDLLLADGGYFSLDKPELRELARLIAEARALQESPSGSLRISKFQAGLWAELAELGVVSHQAAAWQRQAQGLLSIDTIARRQPPVLLNAQLRPYQLDGFAWLAFLWEHKLGGILADDMGLGKTLQSLALIGHARQAEPGSPPFLIVAPTSVVPNWAAEAGKFAPGLKVVPLTETTARRGVPLAEVAAGADAVVTSYTLLRIDFEEYSKLGWSGLILDEAQNAKNHQSKIYQCVRKLATPFKVAITGTPMENNLMELWSLLSITAAGLFPNPERFRDYYARPIENHGNDHAELLDKLRRRIKPLVKRRTKEQVAADLPPKQEQVLEVDLHPKHRKLYQTQLQRERQKVLGLIDDLNAHRFTILRSLTLLRQLSLHAGLVDEANFDLPSAKIDTLVEHLRYVAGSGHRALVFSQFTGFLRKVRERLDAEGLAYCYLDGQTRNRASVIANFKEGTAPVFVISLKAGGFGLNLTEADYCFLLDPWWNPATETQAIDRTHRIGQTRNVMVYRLIARDTIEEKVMALKARKADLFASVLDDGNVFGSSLSADDLRGLFG